ncbi:Sac-like phosphoinositide polyphosphatase [Ordospora colligata]|uniref:Sac-like phosphoinositide polyphosphatase n=1 Tax=Ordospora colligata OC4 TaxID=1354746 RepID=A0A0B2UM66_9MICR|nr:Sac-like phosphoinositide polyphosphatase [Ordospora colligata OC4]KHN70070.1 Sac-like phosphoinositide polyphosphatase [Ordospora colligata OC4]TBU16452.1 Sac-like phosphoinositide polyphosphatase [Ordospora colligata]TBU16637.1 Sac-like phosphoinositide polyphosphatase [Ordospora colligata]TBU19210.1 Sac-like phosphoinositide polyphosphatase [Ordospora colligata]
MSECKRLIVNITPSSVLLNDAQSGSVLDISRRCKPGKCWDLNAHGVYGMITIGKCMYLVLIVDGIHVGKMYEHAVHEIRKVEIVQMKGEEKHDREIINVKKILENAGIYYSEYPLYKSKSIQNSDDDFLFNLMPRKAFLEYIENDGDDCDVFLVSCIQGGFGAENYQNLCMRLVSRRSQRRIGTRYFSRGADAQGYVSNHVETEQFVYDGEKTTSYMQVRGSIPLLWQHEVGYRYNPKIVVKDEKVFAIADDAFVKKYGDVLYLNLIRHSGYEGLLHDAYKRQLTANSKKAVHFNFSEEGRELTEVFRQKIIQAVNKTLSKQGYFDSKEAQKGIIRTNCIDCLDRTNVAQFVIGSEVLGKQLSEFECEGKDMLRKKYNEMWIQNGHSLSRQYAGSSALKSHFLRGNTRKITNKLFDMSRSLRRYVVNRFGDRGRHIAYHIITGDCSKAGITTPSNIVMKAKLFVGIQLIVVLLILFI